MAPEKVLRKKRNTCGVASAGPAGKNSYTTLVVYHFGLLVPGVIHCFQDATRKRTGMRENLVASRIPKHLHNFGRDTCRKTTNLLRVMQIRRHNLAAAVTSLIRVLSSLRFGPAIRAKTGDT